MKIFKFGLSGYDNENHIIGLIFVISILLPQTGALYLVNPLLLFYLITKYNRSRNFVSFGQALMAFIIVISVMWNTFAGVNIATKSLIRAIYIFMIILFFPFCGNVKIPSFYIYFTAICILLSQVCYIFNIGSVISVIDRLYPYTGDLDSQSTDYLLGHAQDAGGSLYVLQSIRFGGLFHNSNQCMKYMSLCTIAFLVENHDDTVKSHLPFLAIVLFSALLAGSRTGFVIIFLTVVIAYVIKFGTNKTSVFIYAVLGFLLFAALSKLFSENFRIFQISSGLQEGGSLSLKFANLKYYCHVIDSIRAYLVGNASLENIQALYHTPFTKFDSEWGYAIYFYGFIFLGLYTIFLIRIVKRLKGIYVVSAFMLLWIISSTILFSYRTSFAFFFLLSKYVTATNQLNYGKSIQ